MDTIAYKGYIICRYFSDLWIIERDLKFICYAKDPADAKRIIDTELNPGHND